jgi:hemerythrin
MESPGFPLSDAHKVSHANLVDRIRDMQIRFSRDQLPAGELIGFITYDVIAEHIAKEYLNIPSKEKLL